MSFHDGSERRRYIRHPSDIPIEIAGLEGGAIVQSELDNVSFGGLCFKSASAYEAGAVITIRIPFVRPPFQAKSRVSWCRAIGASFFVGIEFLEMNDAFRARMVEQVCHIEHYKNDVLLKTGRKLTGREAAAEWIDKYAEKFPS